MVETFTPIGEVTDAIKETGGDALKYCYQCGTCETVCPWNRVRRFPIRKIMHQSQLGLVEFESEDIWLCATCDRCVKSCPRGVEIIEVFKAMRRMLVPDGVVPASIPNLRGVMTSLASVGNPWRQEAKDRTNWTKGRNVKDFTETTELLYFPCCTAQFDPRALKIAQATSDILAAVGVDYGILGAKEVCCGESARKVGNEDLFKRLARENIKTFIDNGVKKILVSSPHCYHTFKNEYTEFKANFEVVHITQYLAEQLKNGKLKFKKEYKKTITYHDPCYLGRHNGIYDEPRRVLQSIPGLKLVEMADNRETSLCCGGGGGRIWEETKKGERFADIRIQQAIDAGAEVLVTSCPYCMVMFEDAAASANNVIQIKDITEVIQEVI